MLVDYTRKRRAQKRDGGERTHFLMAMGASKPAGDLLEVHEALNRLEAEDARLATLIEIGDSPE